MFPVVPVGNRGAFTQGARVLRHRLEKRAHLALGQEAEFRCFVDALNGGVGALQVDPRSFCHVGAEFLGKLTLQPHGMPA